jgi:putative transcriptional regulator
MVRNKTESKEIKGEFGSTFDEISAALSEAIEHAEGKRTLRTTSLPRPPKALSGPEIRRLRTKMKLSQALFARCLNISVKTVQAWEQGTGRPTGAGLKLLDIARKNPDLLLENCR